MIKNGYAEKLIIKYSDIDQNLALKPFAILNFLQDIASKNAEDLGFGYSYIHEKNYAWFLIKYHMEFSEYPEDIGELTLITEPRGYNKLFAYRDFEFLKNNKNIARISSMWSIVDVKSRTMVPINNVFINNEKMIPYTKKQDDLSFEKIPTIQNIHLSKEFNIRYNDIDVNGHANNGNYIIWALEPLDFEFRCSKKIKTVDMIFKKESKYNEKIISEVEILDELTTIHRLTNQDNEEIYSMKCHWT